MRKLTTEEVQKKIDEKHGKNVFEIKGEYTNSRTKVLISHIKCGYEWHTIVGNIISGHGCPKCARNQRKTQEQFVDEVKKLVSDEYTVLSKYQGNHNKVIFRHELCGNEFEMEANSFLRGQRCPNERYDRIAKSNSKTEEETKKLLEERTHGEYKIIEFKGIAPRKKLKSRIKHLKCGKEFYVPITRLINNVSGCPYCSESHGEKFVERFLNDHHFSYKRQYRIPECRNKRPLPFDFAVFENGELKHLIEYDGEQHIKPKFGLKEFDRVIKNDKIKDDFCKNNKTHLIRIPYKRLSNNKFKNYIYEILDNKLISSQP